MAYSVTTGEKASITVAASPAGGPSAARASEWKHINPAMVNTSARITCAELTYPASGVSALSARIQSGYPGGCG